MDDTYYTIIEEPKRKDEEDDEEEGEGEGEDDELLQKMMELSMQPMAEEVQQPEVVAPSRTHKPNYVLLVMIIPTSETTYDQILQEFSHPVDIREVEDWADLYNIQFYHLPTVDLTRNDWVETLKLEGRYWVNFHYLHPENAYFIAGTSFEETYETKSFIPELVEPPKIVQVLPSISEFFSDKLEDDDPTLPPLIDPDMVESGMTTSSKFEIIRSLIDTIARKDSIHFMSFFKDGLDCQTGPYGTIRYNLLHLIFQYDRFQMIEYVLLDNFEFLRRNINQKNLFGRSAAFFAKSMNRRDILQFLQNSNLLRLSEVDCRGIGLCNLHIVRDLLSAEFSSYDMNSILHMQIQEDNHILMSRHLVERRKMSFEEVEEEEDLMINKDIICDVYKINYDERLLSNVIEDIEYVLSRNPCVCLDIARQSTMMIMMMNATNTADQDGIVKNLVSPQHLGVDVPNLRLEYTMGYSLSNKKFSTLESRKTDVFIRSSHQLPPTFDQFKEAVDTVDLLIQLCYLITILHHLGLPFQYFRLSQVLVYTHKYPNLISKHDEQQQQQQQQQQSMSSFFKSEIVFLQSTIYLSHIHSRNLDRVGDEFFSYNPKLPRIEESKYEDGEVRDIYSLCKIISWILYNGECPPLLKKTEEEEEDVLRNVISEVIRTHPIGEHNSHNITAKSLIYCLEDYLDRNIENVMVRKYGKKDSENFVLMLKSFTLENRIRRNQVLYHFTYYDPIPYAKVFPNYTEEVEESIFNDIREFLGFIDLNWQNGMIEKAILLDEEEDEEEGAKKKKEINPTIQLLEYTAQMEYYLSPFLRPEFQRDMKKEKVDVATTSPDGIMIYLRLIVAELKKESHDGRYWPCVLNMLRVLSTLHVFQMEVMGGSVLFRDLVKDIIVTAKIFRTGHVIAMKSCLELFSNLFFFRNCQDMLFGDDFIPYLEDFVCRCLEFSLGGEGGGGGGGGVEEKKKSFVLFRMASNVAQCISIRSHLYFRNIFSIGSVTRLVKCCFDVLFVTDRLSKEDDDEIRCSRKLTSRFWMYVEGVKRILMSLYSFMKFESGYITLMKEYYLSKSSSSPTTKKKKNLVFVLEKNELFFNRYLKKGNNNNSNDDKKGEKDKKNIRMMLVSLGAMLLESEDWIGYKRRKFMVIKEDPFIRKDIKMGLMIPPSQQLQQQQKTSNNEKVNNNFSVAGDPNFYREIHPSEKYDDWETEQMKVVDLQEDLKNTYREHFFLLHHEKNFSQAMGKLDGLIKILPNSDPHCLYFRVRRADLLVHYKANYSDALMDLSHVNRFLKHDKKFGEVYFKESSSSRVRLMDERFWLVKAYICKMMKFSEQAIEDLQKALQISRESHAAYFQLGEIFLVLKDDLDMAIVHYTECIDLIEKRLQNEKRQRNRDMLIDDYVRALQNRAPCYMKINQPKHAVEDYNRLSSYIEEHWVFFQRGKILLEKLMDYSGALSDFNKCLSIFRGKRRKINDRILASILYVRCKTYRKLRLYEPALRDISVCIEKKRDQKEYYFERAEVYKGLNMVSEATTDFNHALHLEERAEMQEGGVRALRDDR